MKAYPRLQRPASFLDSCLQGNQPVFRSAHQKTILLLVDSCHGSDLLSILKQEPADSRADEHCENAIRLSLSCTLAYVLFISTSVAFCRAKKMILELVPVQHRFACPSQGT